MNGNKRFKWLDNLRVFTIYMVVIYHVIWIFNAHSAFPGFIHFSTNQYQDVFMYMVYPWFMVILFLVAGMSARFYFNQPDNTISSFLSERTKKLLIPSILGVLLFHWITGYFAIEALLWAHGELMEWWHTALWHEQLMEAIFVGKGQLWFIQLLWVYSMLIIVIRLIEKDRVYLWIAKHLPSNLIILFFICVSVELLMAQTVMGNPSNLLLSNIIYQYRPIYYFIPFLLGYYVFSHEEIVSRMASNVIWLLFLGGLGTVLLVLFTWGQDPLTAKYLRTWYNVAYAWIMIFMLMGLFRKYMDYSNSFTLYLASSSYGLYILHMFIIVIIAYAVCRFTTLPAWGIYSLVLIAAIFLTLGLYECLRRVPIVSFCLFGSQYQANVSRILTSYSK